jgi:MraZ protein
MFKGRSDHTVDAKGRVSIPAGFRMEIQRRSKLSPILTKQPECLALYASEDWDVLARRLTDVDPLRMDGRALQRFLISNSEDCPLDGQGRILIPTYMREHAKLQREVVIAGLGACIEIWDRERYELDQARTQDRYNEISLEVSKLGH